MKSKFSLIVYFSILQLFTTFAQAELPSDFNPTPFPLGRPQKSECGSWISARGTYRLIITSSTGNCINGRGPLRVAFIKRRVLIGRGVLSQYNNKYCGTLARSGVKKLDLCIWKHGKNLHSNVRQDSPWQPFEIFAKETYY